MKFVSARMAAIVVSFLVSQVSLAKERQLSGPIKVDGSSTVYPVTEAVAEEFQREHPRTRVTVGLSGTGGGMKKFTTGETDISNASRPMKDSEAEKAKENGVNFLQLPVAYDGLSVVVSQRSPLKEITSAELKKLWEPNSSIKKWSDLRKDLPNEPVKLYGPGPDSGTFDFFTEEIMGEARASRSDYTASEDDNVLVRGLVTDPHALGYFGYSYYAENANKLRALKVDGVAPDMKAIESSKYPLSRPLFIYVSDKAAQKDQVVAFVDFYLANAAALAKQVGYTPLPATEYQKHQAAFAEFVRKHGKTSKKAE